MRLIIAEKPSFGEALAKALGAKNKQKGYIEGNDFIVTWCVGHLVGMAMPEAYDEKYKTWSFETLPIIPTAWHMKVAADKRAQYSIIKKLLNDSRIDEIVCATDAGREGECIFRYVYRLSGCRKPVLRLWVSSNEDKAIRKGFNNLRPDSDFDDLYKAGLCRSKADWLIGMNLSRLFTLRYNSLLTIGRVQTPTLGLIVQRDFDIENFVKKKYFDVELDCGLFKAVSERFDDEALADKTAGDCNGKTAVVTDVSKEVKTSNPPKLFSLSALQTAANKRFGYTAKQVLNIAQTLYDSDKKLTTYPRTNSQYLTDEMEDSTLDVINKILTAMPELSSGMNYTPDIKRCINSKKVEDHHAIIPTAEIATYDISSLKENERNVLYLICERLLLATAPVHKYEETKITLNCEGNEFKTSGKVVIEDGFKALEKFFKQKNKADRADKEQKEEVPLPAVSENERFENVATVKKEHWTTPPKPYTDGTLIAEMKSVGKTGIIDKEKKEEIRGIGTEATRADTIEELVRRGYVMREKSSLISTKNGRQLISVVPDKVKSPQMTADWESRFYDIEHGKASDSEFLSEIENYVRGMVTQYNYVDISLSFNEPLGICPRCGKNVLERSTFYTCESGKDGCGFGLSKNILGKNISVAQVKKLLANGRTDMIKGFKSKNGNSFDAYIAIGEQDGKRSAVLGFEEIKQDIVGVCPRCGKNVIEQKLSFSCESGKEGCGFTLWKNDKIRKITIKTADAKKLLSDGKAMLNAVSKNNKKYYAEFELQDTGEYVNLVYVPQENSAQSKPIGKCPKCGAEIKEGQNGCYCSGKCGMNVGKVYGKQLTAEQVKKLLSGQKLSVTIKGKGTVVLPEYVENPYQGKIYYQWGTDRK